MQEKQNIQINQILFGYDSGHRLLASSISLDKTATSTALVLSDLSGQGATPPQQGYLTGYPLPSMGMYALTRTWLATEMPRPGCVWTHALLIDFSDLAAFDDLRLLSLFRRPHGSNDRSNYTSAIKLTFAGDMTQTIFPPQLREEGSETVTSLGHLMAALYSFPNDEVFVFPGDLQIEQLTILMWLQQWPRLRRNFRFCTWSGSDRSRHSDRFDLQYVPYLKSQILRNRNEPVIWVDLTDRQSVGLEWQNAALDVLEGSRNSPIRKFMWRYGAEAEGGRSSYRPLVRLYQVLEMNGPVDPDMAIDAVKAIDPPIASLVSRVITIIINGEQVDNIESKKAVEFIVDNLVAVAMTDENSDDLATKIASLVLRVVPDRIWHLLLSQTSTEKRVAAAAIRKMKPADLLEGINGNGNMLAAVLEFKPELAASPEIWDAPAPIPQMTSWILSNQDVSAPRHVLAAMLEAQNPDVPEIGIAMFGQVAVELVIEHYDNNKIGIDKSRRWLSVDYHHNRYIANALGNVKVANASTLELISHYVGYRHNVKSQPHDEWAELLRSLVPQDLSFHLCAFLMARALSGVSTEPLVLLYHSFNRIHTDLMNNNYDDASWYLLENELPEVSIWERWDRALRVRLAIITFFVNHKLTSNDFLNTISVSDSTMMLFLETARNSSIEAVSRFFPENRDIKSRVKKKKGLFW